MEELIRDLALSSVMAWILGVTAHLLRQPLILSYIVAGFVLGPFGLAWVKSQESISTIGELGLIFMLFMIGLEIDLKKIVRAGKVIVVTGAVQIFGCCLLGIAVFVLMGMPFGNGQWDSLYLGAAIALSSTVIIVKILYDKRELDTLPGRVTLGILVLQDLFAILFLAVQPSLNDLRFDVILLSFGRVGILVASALLVSRFVLPYVFHRIALLPELVLVGALAWCFAVGEIAEHLHLSREMGALVAGVSISTFPYALDVTAKVTALRDFFITLFFVALGMTIPLPSGSVVGLAFHRRRVDARQPGSDGVPLSLCDEAGITRERAAGNQPRTDQRVFARADPGWSRGQSDSACDGERRFIRFHCSRCHQRVFDYAERQNHTSGHCRSEACGIA